MGLSSLQSALVFSEEPLSSIVIVWIGLSLCLCLFLVILDKMRPILLFLKSISKTSCNCLVHLPCSLGLSLILGPMHCDWWSTSPNGWFFKWLRMVSKDILGKNPFLFGVIRVKGNTYVWSSRDTMGSSWSWISIWTSWGKLWGEKDSSTTRVKLMIGSLCWGKNWFLTRKLS